MTFLKLAWRIVLFSLGVGLFLGLGGSWAGLPPLGPLFSPVQGFWQNSAKELSPKRKAELELEGLEQQVKILWDPQGIPHLFAQSDRDLYFAQGYLEASERLFQMDLLTRVGDGRLAEWVGESGLDLDLFFVNLGLRQAAERARAVMMEDELTRDAVLAYSAGVNAYVNSLSYKTFPIEYKLLNVSPGHWTSLRTATFLKLMSFRLAGLNHDLDLTRALQKLGDQRVRNLFPDFVQPIEPVIHEAPRRRGSSPPPPRRPLPSSGQEVFISAFESFPELFKPFRENGSNSWAVSPQRSQSSRTLVANDTHLGFSLPGSWYELALVTPEQSVYGVSFAGAPGIMIGFTPQVAWAVTNAYSDVLDWYEVEFKDENLEQYLFNEEWWNTETYHEEIHTREGKVVPIELVWTHQGVLMHQQDRLGLVARWVPHRGSNELKTFLQLNRAQSYSQCRQALQYFEAPAQNFICADGKNIGLVHQGRLPRRTPGQGRYILDGRTSASDWPDWLRASELPQLENPASGYLRSANQRPVDESFEHFFGWDFPPSYRAQRLTQWLEQPDPLSAQDFIEMQLDNLNLHGQKVLPVMLEMMSRQTESDLAPLGAEALKILSQWNFQDEREQVAPTLFEFWWRHFEDLLWTPVLGEREQTYFPGRTRSAQLILALAQDPNHPDIQWLGGESLEQLLRLSLNQTVASLKLDWGEDVRTWTWGTVRGTHFPHVARIPGLGEMGLSVSGSTHTVNANRGDHGATWRMVVELGDSRQTTQAWVNHPGGQSGNPFDPSYTEFLGPWAEGELRPARLYPQPEDLIEQASATLVLQSTTDKETIQK